jgi:hypothetical protein
MTAVAKACSKVTLSTGSGTSGSAGGSSAGSTGTAGGAALYDCQGRAAALEAA